ncbi:DUF2934 domain-containing protein [Methyloraptor flagellatus]|jgi:hypothetical protein|uniref:DUF2934 domain-containing protein n=1 Tax=Methyloraptor flagellatus TaxID=3162530 RepID=A0AAU7XAQ2_9HYPH
MAQAQIRPHDEDRRNDEQRVRDKAKELWIAEGRPSGREEDFLTEAREIVAIKDSYRDTLEPIGEAGEPVEPALAMANLGDLPEMADQGEQTAPSRATEAATADMGPEGPPGGAAEDIRGDASGQFVRKRGEPNPGGAASANPSVLSGGGDATQTDSGLDRAGLDRDTGAAGSTDPRRTPFRG